MISLSKPDQIQHLRVSLPYTSADEFLDCFGLHLFDDAIFLPTRTSKPVDSTVCLEMKLRDGTTVVYGIGTVESIAYDPTGNTTGMRVRWSKIDPQTHALLGRRRRGPAAETLTGPSVPEKTQIVRSRKAVVGIDLRLFDCSYTLIAERSSNAPVPENTATLRSTVYVDRSSQSLHTQIDLNAGAVLDDAWVIASPLSALGRRVRQVGRGEFPTVTIEADDQGNLAFQCASREITAVEVMAALLRQIKSSLEKSDSDVLVDRSVFVVGNRFGPLKRMALEAAAAQAGWKVHRIVSRTVALAAAYGSKNTLARQRVLLVDPSGVDTSVSVVEITGDDVTVISVVESEKLEPSDPPAIDRLALRALNEAGLSALAIDNVAIISSDRSFDEAALRQVVDRPLLLCDEYECMAAMGAARIGRSLVDSTVRRAPRIVDLMGAGIFIVSPDTGVVRFFDRGTQIPCSKTRAVHLARGQRLEVAVFEGQPTDRSLAELLGVVVYVAPKDVDVYLNLSVSENGTISAGVQTILGTALHSTFDMADLNDDLIDRCFPRVVAEPRPSAPGRLFGGIKNLLKTRTDSEDR